MRLTRETMSRWTLDQRLEFCELAVRLLDQHEALTARDLARKAQQELVELASMFELMARPTKSEGEGSDNE